MKLKYIDSIRGIAILMVILVHVSQKVINLNSTTFLNFEYGQMGVQLFFVASAYTLCLSANNRVNELKPLKKYSLRRFFRIAPLYYLGIVGFFVLKMMIIWFNGGIIKFPEDYTIINVIFNIFFLHGFYPPANNTIVPGGWSIGTEVIFYLLFPFLFNYLKNKFNNPKFIYLLIFLFIVFSQLLIYYLYIKNVVVLNNNFLYYNLINQFSVFLVGIGFYFYSQNPIKINWKIDLIDFLTLTIISLILWNINLKQIFAVIPFISAISFCFLINVFKKNKKINVAILARIGSVSYSMYIIHFIFPMIILPLINLILFKNSNEYVVLFGFYVMSVFGTYFIALVSESYIEKPFIRIGNKIIDRIK